VPGSLWRSHFFFLLRTRPPRPPLFPYTTLFRSSTKAERAILLVADVGRERPRLERVARIVETTEPGQFLMKSIVGDARPRDGKRSEEHTSELQSRSDLVCRLLLEKKKKTIQDER